MLRAYAIFNSSSAFDFLKLNIITCRRCTMSALKKTSLFVPGKKSAWYEFESVKSSISRYLAQADSFTSTDLSKYVHKIRTWQIFVELFEMPHEQKQHQWNPQDARTQCDFNNLCNKTIYKLFHIFFLQFLCFFFNKTYIVFKENLPVTGRVLEEEKCKYFHNVDFKFKVITKNTAD